MTPKLSSEQKQAINEQQGGPVFVVDSDTQEQYVLVPAAAYQKLQSLLSDEALDLRETYPQQEKIAAAAGWDDPAMDDYNDYDSHCKNP